MEKIIIEIGTQEQKEAIKKELNLVEKIIHQLNLSSKISQIIVPDDFDEMVNKIQGTKNYFSERPEQVAIAKNVIKKEKIFLIFSKKLFTKDYDDCARMQTYFHELLHAYNSERFFKPDKETQTQYQSRVNFNILFDEYYVNRKSFELINKLFAKTSLRYKKNICRHCKGFIETAVRKESYNNIKMEIFKFRFHGNIEMFLEAVNPIFDEVSKAIIYCYSYFDSCPQLKRYEDKLLKCKFLNEKTLKLINYIGLKYKENNFELSDGAENFALFFENFGMKFEDTTQGSYCHVINI